jgi:hypothetical protein
MKDSLSPKRSLAPLKVGSMAAIVGPSVTPEINAGPATHEPKL